MESTSFITRPPGSTMASKPSVSSSGPLVQPPSSVSSVSPPVVSSSILTNNNNTKVSDTQAPPPNMSQSSQPVSQQKQSPNIIQNTTPAPNSGIQISGAKTGTVLVGQTVTTSAPTSAGPVQNCGVVSNTIAGGKPAVTLSNTAPSPTKPGPLPTANNSGPRVESSPAKNSPTAPIPAPRVTTATTTSVPANITSTTAPPAASKTSVEAVQSPPKVSSSTPAAVPKTVPSPLPKPEDLPTSLSKMNGGSTLIMKQPPPPVTILPPTPAATPPPVHRQPPSLPQTQPTSSAPSHPGNNNVTTTTNQKHQSVSNPSPPSANNDTPVKEQSGVTQKPQEKPTQPLPPKQTNIFESGLEEQLSKPQDKEHKGNQEKPITGGTSSVTSSKSVSADSSSPAKSTPPPASAVCGGGPRANQSNQKSPSATVKSSAPVPTSGKNQGKKMDGIQSDGEKEVISPGLEKTDNQLDQQCVDLGGGDAQVLDSGVSPNKSVVGGKNDDETENKTDKCNVSDVSAAKVKPVESDENGLGERKHADMTKSVYSQPAHNGGNVKKEEIGDDVRRIMEAIENAGLCGPMPADEYSSFGVNSNNSSGEMAKNAKNRSMSSGMKQQNRPSTGYSPFKGKSASSPTKGRPATASAVSTGSDVTGSPLAEKSSKEKAASGSPAATLPPKSATSGARTSNSRVASARANTAQNNSKTPNENKNSKAKLNGADSCNASPVETETGNSNGSGSRSTSRLRPSSSLYRPTASSALKGVSSASHNNGSPNQNLQSTPATPRTSRSTGTRISRSSNTMGDSAGGSGDAKPTTLRDQFTAFSRFGNKEEDGKHITLSNCDKWMKQAKVIDGKKITTTDTSICFKKLFKTAKKITFEDFKKYVEELAKSKKMEPQELLDKLSLCGPPGLSSATRAAHCNVVDRLTDTSKYTGSHKERFDSTGKGRGIEGRKDVPDGSGYVAAFKEKLDIKEKEIEAKEGSPSPTPAK